MDKQDKLINQTRPPQPGRVQRPRPGAVAKNPPGRQRPSGEQKDLPVRRPRPVPKAQTPPRRSGGPPDAGRAPQGPELPSRVSAVTPPPSVQAPRVSSAPARQARPGARPGGRPGSGAAGRPSVRQTPANRPARPQQPWPRPAWPWEKILSGLVLACLIVGVLAMGFSLFLKTKYEVDIVNLDTAAVKKRDAILVLGCGVYADGSPTPMLRDRMQAGIAAYFKGAGRKLLLSGDHGQKNYDEVNAMKQLALAAGVPEDDIFLDHAGFSTYESLKRGKEIFGLESVCLVSQKYHLYRACYLADSLGLDYCGYPADAYVYGGQFFREVREVLARVKAIFSATLQPQPEALGPAIDITGDGRASWD